MFIVILRRDFSSNISILECNNNYNNILFPFPITNGIAHRKEKKDRERKKNYKRKVAKSIKSQFLYLLIHFFM